MIPLVENDSQYYIGDDADPGNSDAQRRPQPGGYWGGAWNPMNWRRLAFTGDANAPDEYYQAADEAAGAYVAPRIGSAVQTVGGVAETAVGGAMVATGVAAAPGAVLVAHGADTTVAGVRGMVDGENKRTLTAQATTAVTGSETAGTVVDMAVPVVAGTAGGIMIAKQAAKEAAAAGLEGGAAATSVPAETAAAETTGVGESAPAGAGETGAPNAGPSERPTWGEPKLGRS